ncbi:hypothetical protein FOL46_001326 [Perkinsus olseni]|uniref:Uncharacterized protein n=1 Tax=Perkinsus olseni TaxID=32597 RepID=A0A7J6MEK2_PEROL|nr:hypothetical protein FOL46_001326 [Perkinsus olseni]
MYCTTALLLLLLPQSVSSAAAYENVDIKQSASSKERTSSRKQPPPDASLSSSQGQRAPTHLLSEGAKCRVYSWSQDPKEEVYELSVEPNPNTGKNEAKIYHSSDRKCEKGRVERNLPPKVDCYHYLLSAMENEVPRYIFPRDTNQSEAIYQHLKPKIHRELKSDFAHLWRTSVTTIGRTKSLVLPDNSLLKYVLVTYVERQMWNEPPKAGLLCSFGVQEDVTSRQMLRLAIARDFTTLNSERTEFAELPDLKARVDALRELWPATGDSGIPDPSSNASPRRVTDALCKQAFVEYLMAFRAFRDDKTVVASPCAAGCKGEILGRHGMFSLRKGSKAADELKRIERYLLGRASPRASSRTTEVIEPSGTLDWVLKPDSNGMVVSGHPPEANTRRPIGSPQYLPTLPVMYWTAALLLPLLPQSVSSTAAYEDREYAPFPTRKPAEVQRSRLKMPVPLPDQRPLSTHLSTGSKCRVYSWSPFPWNEVYELSVKTNTTSQADDVKAYYFSDYSSSKGIIFQNLSSSTDCYQYLLNGMYEGSRHIVSRRRDVDESIYRHLKGKLIRRLESEFKDLWENNSTTNDGARSLLLPDESFMRHLLVTYIKRKMKNQERPEAPLQCTFSVEDNSAVRKPTPLTLGIAMDFTLHSVRSHALKKLGSLDKYIRPLKELWPATGVSGIPDPSSDASPKEVTDTLCKQAFIEFLMAFRASRTEERDAASPCAADGCKKDIAGEGGWFTIREGSAVAEVVKTIEAYIYSEHLQRGICYPPEGLACQTPAELHGLPKSLLALGPLLQPQGFKCRVFHAFTTAGGFDVVYELSLRGRNVKLYYSVNKGDTDLTRKILLTESLERSGMPDDLPKSQPSDCKATMREVLKYAWNYASGRFRPKEGGALNESSVQQEFSWQLELDSNDKWISFGGKNSYAMPSSLGSDVLTKFAKKVIPEGNEPVELPFRLETLRYLEMEGKDLSMVLNREFTIHHISLPGMSTPWEGMLAAIGHLSQLKKTFYKDKPRRSKDIFRVAYGN